MTVSTKRLLPVGADGFSKVNCLFVHARIGINIGQDAAGIQGQRILFPMFLHALLICLFGQAYRNRKIPAMGIIFRKAKFNFDGSFTVFSKQTDTL